MQFIIIKEYIDFVPDTNKFTENISSKGNIIL